MKDKEIIDMFCLGDEAAIENVQNIYGRMMYCVSLSVTGHHEDAEECCNESLFILWNTIPRTRPKYLWPYIKTIVYRVSMDKKDYNMAGKRGEFYREYYDEENLAVEYNEVDFCVEKLAIQNAINNFIKLLSEEKLSIFQERYGLGFLVEEIARKEDVSVSKVKMALLRMKRELKKCLREENIFL